MKNFLFCLFFGFIFKSNAQEINVDYFNNFRAKLFVNDTTGNYQETYLSNIQTQSLSGRYYFTDKFSLGVGINYSLTKIDYGNNFSATSKTTETTFLCFSPTLKLPIKKIKGLGQNSPDLFFSYSFGIGKEYKKGKNLYFWDGYDIVDAIDYAFIPSFFQLHASFPLKNSFFLNISLRGAQRDLLNLNDYDLFAIRPVQVGFGIGYNWDFIKSRITKGTREVI